MRLLSTVLALLLAATAAARAEPGSEPPFCADSSSTAEIVECASDLYTVWDRRLNTTYRRTIEGLDGSRKEAFRQVQRAWIVYRDANCGFYRGGEGTIAAIEGDLCMVTMTRNRALELEGHLSNP